MIHCIAGQPGNPDDDRPTPDWNLRVLARPVVLDVDPNASSDSGSEGNGTSGTAAEGGATDAAPDLLVAAATAALVAARGRTPDAHLRIGELGRAGVVALVTPAGALEIRETLLGWILVRAWGTPDPADLGAAAHLRAWRLASERRTCGTGNPTDHGPDAPGPTSTAGEQQASGDQTGDDGAVP